MLARGYLLVGGRTHGPPHIVDKVHTSVEEEKRQKVLERAGEDQRKARRGTESRPRARGRGEENGLGFTPLLQFL